MTTTGINVRRASVDEIKEAVRKRIPLMGIRCFGTHGWPDLDELVAIAIILLLGGVIFHEVVGMS